MPEPFFFHISCY